MNDREVLQTALDKCELYLGNTRIEKANMKKFEQLMLDNFFSDNRLAALYNFYAASEVDEASLHRPELSSLNFWQFRP